MLDKLKSLLGSLRFWQLTVAAISEAIALTQPSLSTVLHVVSTWLLAVAAIGTVDKFNE